MVLVPHRLSYQAAPFFILWFKTAACVENFILCWATAYAVALFRTPLLVGCGKFSLNLNSFTSRQHRLRFGLLTWTTKVIQQLAKVLLLNPTEGHHAECDLRVLGHFRPQISLLLPQSIKVSPGDSSSQDHPHPQHRPFLTDWV